MSRRSELPQKRRHIWVYDEDWDFLESRFGDNTDSKLGVGPAIRNITHIWVNNLKAEEQKRMDEAAAKRHRDGVDNAGA